MRGARRLEFYTPARSERGARICLRDPFLRLSKRYLGLNRNLSCKAMGQETASRMVVRVFLNSPVPRARSQTYRLSTRFLL